MTFEKWNHVTLVCYDYNARGFSGICLQFQVKVKVWYKQSVKVRRQICSFLLNKRVHKCSRKSTSLSFSHIPAACSEVTGTSFWRRHLPGICVLSPRFYLRFNSCCRGGKASDENDWWAGLKSYWRLNIYKQTFLCFCK